MLAARSSTIQPRPLPREVSAEALYEVIGNSTMVENGQALLVSIAPIRAALGTRWDARRVHVCQVVERHFRRHLSLGDVWQQVAETCFLAATPEKSGALAMALCYRALKDVLTYFLGEAQPRHLEVSRVSRLTSESVEVQPFSSEELEQADFEAVPIAPAASEPPASSLASLTAWPLQSADGKDLRVSFAVDPVMDLRAWAMAGHRIESRIVNAQSGAELRGAQRRSLMPRDFELIDLAALERGMSRLRGAEVPDKPKLIIQLSFASLSSGRGRSALLERARELQEVMLQAAICELVDVETGVPLSRLSEVVALLRHYFRFVLVQVEPRREAVETAIAAKAQGLTVSAYDLGEEPTAIAAGMREVITLIRGKKTVLMATSLPTNDLLIDAMTVGFSHATLRAERPAG